VLAASVLSAAGCGKKGPPLPPTPRGPLPPEAISARQLGELVEVRLDVPAARGTRPSQQAVRAELIRVTYPGGSTPAADPDAFRRRGVEVASLQQEALEQGERLLLVDRTLARMQLDADGRQARYAVRLRDRRNRPSALVVAPDLGLLPSVPPPRGLAATPTADGVRLAWDVAAADETRRFNLYRSDPQTGESEVPLNAQPLEVGEYLDESVEVGKTYRYFLRVVLAPGRPYRESASGEGVIVLAADRFPPAPPDGLVAVPEGGTVRLFWNPGTDRDLAGYRVYRRRAGGDWVRVGASIVEQATFVDPNVKPGELLSYRVTALDRVQPPNESAPSPTFELQLPGGDGP
jgi:hypothetical protein